MSARSSAAILALLLLTAGCSDDEGDDDDTRDPGDGTVQPGDDIVALEIRPATLVLDPATPFELLCVGLTDDGYRATLDDCTFEIADGTAAEVSTLGKITPREVGTASVLASRFELTSLPSAVEVVAPGAVDVWVTDAQHGTPLEGAMVHVGCPAILVSGATDADGRVRLEGAFEGEIDLVVRAGDHRHTVLRSVQARNVAIAVPPVTPISPRAYAKGTVEFPVEPDTGELALAIALTATPVGPAFTSIQDFMPGERTVSEFGLDLQLPWNLVVHGVVDTFWAPVYEGTSALSVAGGYFDLGEVLSIGLLIEEHGGGAVFNIVGSYADRLILGMHGPFDVPYETATEDTVVEDIVVSMDMDVDREVAVTLLSPPPDFYSSDPPTILAYRELVDDLGWAIAGIGVGTQPFTHPDVDPPTDDDDDSAAGDDDDATGAVRKDDDDPWEVVPVMEASATHPLGTPFTVYGAMATFEGLDVGTDGTMVFSPPMTGTDVVLPSFLPLYAQPVTDEPYGHFRFHGVSQWVDATRAVVVYREEHPHSQPEMTWKYVEVYGPGGPGEFTLPDILIDHDRPDTHAEAGAQNAWTVDAVSLRATSYQAMITDDGLDGLEDFKPLTFRRSVVKKRWWYADE